MRRVSRWGSGLGAGIVLRSHLASGVHLSYKAHCDGPSGPIQLCCPSVLPGKFCQKPQSSSIELTQSCDQILLMSREVWGLSGFKKRAKTQTQKCKSLFFLSILILSNKSHSTDIFLSHSLKS